MRHCVCEIHALLITCLKSLIILITLHSKMFIGGLNWETTERKYFLLLSHNNKLVDIVEPPFPN